MELMHEEDLQQSGWEVIADPEHIYWRNDLTDILLSHQNKKDIRQKGTPKPVIFQRMDRWTHAQYCIIVEWNYGKGGWIVHDTKGNIWGRESSKEMAIHRAERVALL